MSTSLHIPRWSPGLAVGFLLFCAQQGNAVADPPATETGSPSSSASDAQSLAPKGTFMSSLKQAFSEDLDKEVVRGHFDVGSAPDVHRYYCLVNPKTGKGEPNAVAGQLVARADKMTGIKGAAVTFFTCAEAEQKGILVTSGYVLSAAASGKMAPPAPVQKPAVAAAPAPAATPAPVAAAPGPVATAAGVPAAAAAAAPAAPAVPMSAEGSLQSEVMAVYARFIAGQNAHDRAAVSEVLLDSKDFVWAQYGGGSIWGHKEAMEAFAEDWKGTWRLEPQQKEMRIASIAPDVAVLITPLLFTAGDPGKEPSTVSIRWGGVFVKTKSGWRIASIFITPRAPKGG